MHDSNNNRLDKALRDKAMGYEKQPANRVWNKLQPQLAAPVPASAANRTRRRAGLLLLALLLLLTGNLLPRFFANTQENNDQPATIAVEADHNKTASTKTEAFAGVTSKDNPKAEEKGTAESIPEASKQPHTKAYLPALAKGASTPEKTKAGSATTIVREKTVPSRFTAVTPTDINQAVIAEEQPNSDQKAATTNHTITGNGQPQKGAVPVVFVSLLKAEQHVQELLHHQNPEANHQNQLVQALYHEKQELAKLQTRTDSLLALYVPEPEYVAVADSTPKPKIKNRWSVALALAPELNFMSLAAPAADTLLEMRRNHESGRAGANAALSLEYQISNRLRLGVGIGYSTYGAELRLTNRQTILDVRYDTASTITTNNYSSTYTNYIVREDSTAVMDPIFNQNGQVIGYNTVYVTHPDTTWQTIVVEGTDTVRVQTITPLIHKTEKTTYKKLKPQYHFVTLPVMLHYRLTGGNRWWAEAGVGGQLQLFRGGTQLVTSDGRTYQTEKVGPREGPFRPVNLALMGNLAVNYGLTERLSVSVAPAVRWQVQSVYKKETGLTQKPVATGLQVGLRYTL